MKQFVRDWSEEVIPSTYIVDFATQMALLQGAREREMCYKPLIDALVKFYPNAQSPEERCLTC